MTPEWQAQARFNVESIHTKQAAQLYADFDNPDDEADAERRRERLKKKTKDVKKRRVHQDEETDNDPEKVLRQSKKRPKRRKNRGNHRPRLDDWLEEVDELDTDTDVKMDDSLSPTYEPAQGVDDED